MCLFFFICSRAFAPFSHFPHYLSLHPCSLLLVGSDDGAVRLWRGIHDPSAQDCVSAFTAVRGMTTAGPAKTASQGGAGSASVATITASAAALGFSLSTAPSHHSQQILQSTSSSTSIRNVAGSFSSSFSSSASSSSHASGAATPPYYSSSSAAAANNVPSLTMGPSASAAASSSSLQQQQASSQLSLALSYQASSHRLAASCGLETVRLWDLQSELCTREVALSLPPHLSSSSLSGEARRGASNSSSSSSSTRGTRSGITCLAQFSHGTLLSMSHAFLHLYKHT